MILAVVQLALIIIHMSHSVSYISHSLRVILLYYSMVNMCIEESYNHAPFSEYEVKLNSLMW